MVKQASNLDDGNHFHAHHLMPFSPIFVVALGCRCICDSNPELFIGEATKAGICGDFSTHTRIGVSDSRSHGSFRTGYGCKLRMRRGGS